MLDPQLLDTYINGFYGYGNLEGRYWFVGIEEAGANTREDNAARVNVWNSMGQPEVRDLVEYHSALGLLGPFLGPNPKIQKTWGGLIRILLAAHCEERGMDPNSITPDDVKAYQRDRLGRATGETCLLELLPLSAKSVGHWMWEIDPPLPYLSSRKAYQAHCSDFRPRHIAALIRRYRPGVVTFYGLSGVYMERWKQIAQVSFSEVSADGRSFYMGDNGHTVFAVVQHPAYAFGPPPSSYFYEVGRAITIRRHAIGAGGGEVTKASAYSTSAAQSPEQPEGPEVTLAKYGPAPRPGRATHSSIPHIARRAPDVASIDGRSHDALALPATSAPPLPQLQVGDQVKHSVFGEGEVLEATPSGDDQRLAVAFRAAGVKKMMARAAKLERI